MNNQTIQRMLIRPVEFDMKRAILGSNRPRPHLHVHGPLVRPSRSREKTTEPQRRDLAYPFDSSRRNGAANRLHEPPLESAAVDACGNVLSPPPGSVRDMVWVSDQHQISEVGESDAVETIEFIVMLSANDS